MRGDFFSLLQKNVLVARRLDSREDLRLAIVTWIETNGSHRRRLGRLTSVEVAPSSTIPGADPSAPRADSFVDLQPALLNPADESLKRNWWGSAGLVSGRGACHDPAMAATDSIPPAPPLPGVVPARARTVYVVTHPEATHHVDGLVGGQLDSELTAKGREDAGRIAAALAGRIGVGASRSVVSSDLRRTAQTATVIGDILGIAPVFDSRLQEKSYGVAEGREQFWLDERFVPPPAVGDRLRHHEGIDGAETRLEVACRVYEATSDALAREVDDLVIVTHGYAATFVVAAWIGMPIEVAGHVAFHVRSGSITTLREDDFFHNRAVLAVGETSHLQR